MELLLVFSGALVGFALGIGVSLMMTEKSDCYECPMCAANNEIEDKYNSECV